LQIVVIFFQPQSYFHFFTCYNRKKTGKKDGAYHNN